MRDRAPTRAERYLNIVVCCVARRGGSMLGKTLVSLSNLMPPEDATVSFVVVGNDKDRSSVVVAQDALERFRGYVLLHRADFDSDMAQARNTGVRVALSLGADVILFTNDDQTVAQNWLDRMITEYRNSRSVLIGGPVSPVFSSGPKTFLQKIVQAGLSAQEAGFVKKIKRRLRKDRADLVPLSTRNWLADASVFREHELFFEGSKGAAGWHDLALLERIRDAGLSIGWSSDAVVFETVPEGHMSLRHQFLCGYENSALVMQTRCAKAGRAAMVPRLLLSLSGRTLMLLVSIFRIPLTKGRSLVQFTRHAGWLAGRVAGFFR